jgi:hypothetical protein
MYFGISEKRQRLVYLYPNEPSVYDISGVDGPEIKPALQEGEWIEGAKAASSCSRPPRSLARRCRASRCPSPSPAPGFKGARWASAFSADGRCVAVSSESDGGRGLAVYDVATRAPRWSRLLDATSRQVDARSAWPVAFAQGDAIVLAGRPGAISVHRTTDGAELGRIETTSDLRDGFVVEPARNRVWLYAAELAPVPIPGA